MHVVAADHRVETGDVADELPTGLFFDRSDEILTPIA